MERIEKEKEAELSKALKKIENLIMQLRRNTPHAILKIFLVNLDEIK